MNDLDRAMALLAKKQHGVFSREQALTRGSRRMVDRRIASGIWLRVRKDVYTFRGTPGSWDAKLMAACLSVGRGTVISCRAAAALWSAPNFEPGPIGFTTTRKRHRPELGDIVHQASKALPRGDVTTIKGIPVTRAMRTLIDLAAALTADNPIHVEIALDYSCFAS